MNALTLNRVGFAIALRTNTIWLALLFSVSVVGRGWGDTITLTTPGDGSVTVPTGYEWTNVTIQCWGGGGGGATGSAYNGTGGGGGGGGGGAYAYQGYTTLAPGTYNYYIGSGGSGSTWGGGGGGGNTIWNYGGDQDIIAGGGAGGTGYGDVIGAGGLVLAGTGYPGGDGGGGGPAYGSGGGGGASGGPSGAGGVGGTVGVAGGVGGSGGDGYGPGGSGGSDNGYDGYSGNNGIFPGGGGGGGSSAYTINGGINSGQGANGEIIVTYTSEAVPEPASLELLGTALLGLGAVHLRRVARRSARPTAFREPQGNGASILAFRSNSTRQADLMRRAA